VTAGPRGGPNPFRPDIEALTQNGITRLAMPRLDDPDVIPLWFGEGDEVTPAFIRDAAKQALDDGDTFYTHTRGRPALRLAIKAYLDRIYDIDLDPDRVSVPGAAMLGITLAVQMVAVPGARGLIVSPNWPNIETTFRVAGMAVDFVRQRETPDGWSLTAQEIIDAVGSDTKAIFLNSPCNPTGWIMPTDQQQLLLEHCRDRGILLIADEVYHRTVYDGSVAPSFLNLARPDDPLIVVNGFSKAWAMTGWRIGWVVAPARHATQWAVLSECFNTGTTVFAQQGAIAALEHGEAVVTRLQSRYAANRKRVIQAFSNHPEIELAEPAGAFYAFPRLPSATSSWDFAQTLLDETNVGVSPGYTFGPGNDQHFRLCFAQSDGPLQEGLDRILRFLDAGRHRSD
jgi:aspartate/methionine/tyrosine aminotransferase